MYEKVMKYIAKMPYYEVSFTAGEDKNQFIIIYVPLNHGANKYGFVRTESGNIFIEYEYIEFNQPSIQEYLFDVYLDNEKPNPELCMSITGYNFIQ